MSALASKMRRDDDVTIARAIIDLGHNLGLVVVTEGVEMREIWDRLAAMRCDVAQDYYLSRPLPAADLTYWVRSLPQLLEKAG